MLLTWLASFLSGPVVNGVISAYRARLDAQSTSDARAVELAQKAIEAEIDARRQMTEMRRAEGAWGPIGILVFGFGFVVLMYFGKVVLWDAMLGLGSTDPIRGAVADWITVVIAFLFGGSTVTRVASMAISRWGRR